MDGVVEDDGEWAGEDDCGGLTGNELLLFNDVRAIDCLHCEHV